MKILVVNCGSSSLKYQLIDMANEKQIAKGICERIGVSGHIEGTTGDGRSFSYDAALPDHKIAFEEVKKVLLEGECKVLNDLSEVRAIGHRVVQGGALFNKSVLIDDEVIKGVESLVDLAPLHNPAHLQGIYACMNVFGPNVPEVAVFDNAFHSTMPPEAYIFPIPYEYYEKYKIRRYGFHGSSHRFVSERCAQLMGRRIENLKIVTCHIGSGASITAIKHGKVADTSMGLTPLDGFIMGTRTGAIDPSVITYLQAKEGWTPDRTNDILNKQSGVLGVSGVGIDDRDVRAAANQGDRRARLAREIQRYQIRKFIGSYAAAMEGIDAVVFTGGIGENVEDFRADICVKLKFLGIDFDNDANEIYRFGKEGEITRPNSKVRVFIIPTNEELVIARDTKDIVEAL